MLAKMDAYGRKFTRPLAFSIDKKKVNGNPGARKLEFWFRNDFISFWVWCWMQNIYAQQKLRAHSYPVRKKSGLNAPISRWFTLWRVPIQIVLYSLP